MATATVSNAIGESRKEILDSDLLMLGAMETMCPQNGGGGGKRMVVFPWRFRTGSKICVYIYNK